MKILSIFDATYSRVNWGWKLPPVTYSHSPIIFWKMMKYETVIWYGDQKYDPLILNLILLNPKKSRGNFFAKTFLTKKANSGSLPNLHQNPEEDGNLFCVVYLFYITWGPIFGPEFSIPNFWSNWGNTSLSFLGKISGKWVRLISGKLIHRVLWVRDSGRLLENSSNRRLYNYRA